jgi:hypothetical protein
VLIAGWRPRRFQSRGRTSGRVDHAEGYEFVDQLALRAGSSRAVDVASSDDRVTCFHRRDSSPYDPIRHLLCARSVVWDVHPKDKGVAIFRALDTLSDCVAWKSSRGAGGVGRERRVDEQCYSTVRFACFSHRVASIPLFCSVSNFSVVQKIFET